MLVLHDTEFTAFVLPDLISIALVFENGGKFYFVMFTAVFRSATQRCKHPAFQRLRRKYAPTAPSYRAQHGA